jgi:hypothetical protein
MIEFVGFDTPDSPREPGMVEPEAAALDLAESGVDPASVPHAIDASIPGRISIHPEHRQLEPSVITAGVASIAPGKLSLVVPVGPGFPAIAASLTDADAGVGVSVVSLDGYGTATIDLNRPSGSEVRVAWYVVQPT